MKKKLIFALLLGSSVVFANPAFADRNDRDFRKHDSYHNEYRGEHRGHHVDRYRDSHRYDWRDQRSNRYSYRLGYRDARNDYRHSHSHSHNNHYRRYDNDWYKWIAGVYLAGELIHHFHGNRICYDHH